MKNDQLAINSVSTRCDSLERTLAAYASAGFRRVEFCLPQVKAWLAEGRSTANLEALLERHGLRCIGGFETTVSCFADDHQQAANHAIHVANGELFDALGGGTIVVGTDGPPERSDDDLRTIGGVLRRLAERLPESVALAIEFNWSPVVKSLKSAYRVAVAADHPRVGILFDPAHYHCTPTKFEDLTAEVAGRILHVHVDDMRDKPGDQCNCNADRALPGRGHLDLPAILGRIEEHGYAGSFSIEMFSDELWAMPVEEAARRLYDSLARLCEDA